jgi:ABC transporter substrate binding protein
MKRREFIAGLESAVAWPLTARAQQTAVIGFRSATSVDRPTESGVSAFLREMVRRGLSETGYFESRNLAFEYRTAEGHLERLPALTDNLVRLKVAAIIATSHAPALAAQAATKSIPIIFFTGTDPVDTGLVGSLNRAISPASPLRELRVWASGSNCSTNWCRRRRSLILLTSSIRAPIALQKKSTKLLQAQFHNMLTRSQFSLMRFLVAVANSLQIYHFRIAS